MQDPVSWLIIERGWEVVASDGAKLGHVESVVGDSGKDIFNGLVVTPGLLRPNRYVPAERVGLIVEGRVELQLAEDAFERLDEDEPPGPSLEVRAD